MGRSKQPNILFVMTDQHNHRAVSYADHADVETPNINRIADTGTIFEDAYCPSPICGPSRASIFTGQYPQSHGFTGNNATFSSSVSLLPERLQQAGYTTGLVGKLHLNPKTASHGFDFKQIHDAMYDVHDSENPWHSDYVQWLADKRFDGDVEEVIRLANRDENALLDRHSMYQFLMGSNWRSVAEHSNTWVTNESLRFLQNNRKEPFFLFTSYFGPHQPMLAPGQWADRYQPDEIELPPEFDLDPTQRPCGRATIESDIVAQYFDEYNWSEQQYRNVLAAYYGQIAMIDAGIGELLDELEEQGLDDNTVVVFTSDHGDHAGQFGWFSKTTMYANSVRVPLVINDPENRSQGGRRTRHVVNNLSLYDTILSFARLDHDVDTAGRALQPLLNDPTADRWSDTTYSELPNTWMVVDGRFKLIRQERPDGRHVFELYDRSEDVPDGTNLWDRPAVREQQEALFEMVEERMSAP